MNTGADPLLNEVINSDMAGLAEVIDSGRNVNILGICGEAPLHIAIYKRDEKMINMLLDAGADIMYRNAQLDCAMHIAARMGLANIVRQLYNHSSDLNRKRLFLQARNKHGFTALDIACRKVEDLELDMTRLYASWEDETGTSLDNEKEPLQFGRIECREFLREKMKVDIADKEQGCVEEMVTQNNDFDYSAGILRGRSSSTTNSRIFYNELDYPAFLDTNTWNKDDRQFFLKYKPGVDKVMRKLHTRDFVTKATHSGAMNASLLLRKHEMIVKQRFDEGYSNNKFGFLTEEEMRKEEAHYKEYRDKYDGVRGYQTHVERDVDKRENVIRRANLDCEERGSRMNPEGLYKNVASLEGLPTWEKTWKTLNEGGLLHDADENGEVEEKKGAEMSVSGLRRVYRIPDVGDQVIPSGGNFSKLLIKWENDADAACQEQLRKAKKENSEVNRKWQKETEEYLKLMHT